MSERERLGRTLVGPLAIVPLAAVGLLSAGERSTGLLFVAAISACAGLLAWLDRARASTDWFERFPGRAVLAPLILTVVVACACQDGSAAVLLAAYLWGLLHAAGRTRDLLGRSVGKDEPASAVPSAWEGVATLCWFVLAPLVSANRLGQILDLGFDMGLRIPAAATVHWFRLVWLGLAVLSTAGYLWSLVPLWRHDPRAALARITMATTSVGVWWLCTFGFEHMLVSIGVWAVCHQAQRHALRDPLRPRAASAVLGAYLGMGVAFAWAGLVGSDLATRSAGHLLESFLVTATLLSFYFAGYAWRCPPDVTLGRPAGGYVLRWAIVLACVLGFANPRPGPAHIHPTPGDVDRYRALVAAVPADAAAHHRLAQALDRAGDPAGALASAQAATSLRPGVAHYEAEALLVAALRVPAWERLEVFEAAAALDPMNADAHYWIGHERVTQGQGEEAIPSFRMAVAIDPRFANAHFELAVQLVQSDAPLAESSEHMVLAALLSPENAAIQSYLGWLYYLKGSIDQSILHYRAALALDPTDLKTRVNLAEMFAAAGKRPKALFEYRRVLDVDPDNFVAHKGMARALELHGMYSRSLEHYRRAHELAPRRVDVLYALGYMLSTWPLETLGDPDEALVIARRLERILGEDPVSFDLLGMALAQGGQMDEAVQHARRAVEMFEERGDEEHAVPARSRLATYEAGQPFRSPEGARPTRR